MVIATGVGADAARDESAFSQPVMLLIVLTMLLGAFLLAIALITVFRRRRLRALKAKRHTAALADPWREAAQRLEIDPPRRRRGA